MNELDHFLSTSYYGKLYSAGASALFEAQNINKDFLNEDGTRSKELMPDYLHPSAAGYKVWGKAITPFIQRFVDGR